MGSIGGNNSPTGGAIGSGTGGFAIGSGSGGSTGLGGYGGSEIGGGQGGARSGTGGAATGGTTTIGSGGIAGTGGQFGSGGFTGSGGVPGVGGRTSTGGISGAAGSGGLSAGSGGGGPGGAPASGGTSGSGGAVGCSTAGGARTICDSGSCVPTRRVFVSSSAVTPDFGGALGADGKCQTFANLAGLGGAWKAWVSDTTTSPSLRFSMTNVPYRLLDGTVIASNWTTLVSGILLAGIDKDEFASSKSGKEVWTATKPDGTLTADGCAGFTSGSASANSVAVGISGNTDAMWTNAYVQFCDRTNVRLYCFEQ